MIRIAPIWPGVPCLTEAESADRRLCEQLAMMDGRWVRMDLLEFLVIAMTERGLGNEKDALEYLDAAAELFGIKIEKPKRGRKPLAGRDPDSPALRLMDAIARGRGISRAETLARLVLERHPQYRLCERDQVRTADVKRLAAKFRKAKPKI